MVDSKQFDVKHEEYLVRQAALDRINELTDNSQCAYVYVARDDHKTIYCVRIKHE